MVTTTSGSPWRGHETIEWMTKLSCGRMIKLLANPLPPSLVSQLSLFLSLPVCRLSSLQTGEGGGGGWGTKSYDREKAWPSINQIIPYSLERALLAEWPIEGRSWKLTENPTRRAAPPKGLQQSQAPERLSKNVWRRSSRVVYEI